MESRCFLAELGSPAKWRTKQLVGQRSKFIRLIRLIRPVGDG